MGVGSGCRDVEGPDMAQRVSHLAHQSSGAAQAHWPAGLYEILLCDLSRPQHATQRTGKAAAMGKQILKPADSNRLQVISMTLIGPHIHPERGTQGT